MRNRATLSEQHTIGSVETGLVDISVRVSGPMPAAITVSI
jgi:hypothetical protein